MFLKKSHITQLRLIFRPFLRSNSKSEVQEKEGRVKISYNHRTLHELRQSNIKNRWMTHYVWPSNLGGRTIEQKKQMVKIFLNKPYKL